MYWSHKKFVKSAPGFHHLTALNSRAVQIVFCCQSDMKSLSRLFNEFSLSCVLPKSNKNNHHGCQGLHNSCHKWQPNMWGIRSSSYDHLTSYNDYFTVILTIIFHSSIKLRSYSNDFTTIATMTFFNGTLKM
jgi:hypothetical protein